MTELALEEFLAHRMPQQDPELALIECAMFIEEELGITIADGQMTEELLGSDEAVRRFVRSADVGVTGCAESAE